MANINHYWLNPSWYNFMSSEWGGIIVKLIGLVIFGFFVRWVRKHFECHVESPENCHRIGHPVAGTGHRACRKHHPHAEEKGSITAADILRHHENSGE
jgi:hypothetical protein